MASSPDDSSSRDHGRWDPYPKWMESRRPRLYGQVARLVDVLRVGEQLCYPGNEHAPARVIDRVDVVDLDTHHGPVNSGIELGTSVRGEHDVSPEYTNIHRESDRKAVHTEYHPA